MKSLSGLGGRERSVTYAGGKTPAGGRLLQFALCIALIGGLAAILLDRLWWYQEYTEYTVVETTAINMRTGLQWRKAELMALERESDIAALIGSNPIHLLATRPPNYFGEVDDASLAHVPAGNWYFDLKSRELVYQPHLDRFFESVLADRGTIRYRLDRKPAAQASATSPWTGVELMQISQYKWF